ncbi:MAG: hypothetical protein E7290_05725 [Lachnospiraceae bacterium]|nr:hypothetical protein [Lachnospiraceae bacterium]
MQSVKGKGLLMRLDDDDEFYEGNREHNRLMLNMILIMSLVVLLVVGLVFIENEPWKKNGSSAKNKKNQQQTEVEMLVESVQSLLADSADLRSDDLNIWSLPEHGKSTQQSTGDGTVINKTTGETVSEQIKDEKTPTTSDISTGMVETFDAGDKETLTQEEIDSLSQTHTLVNYADGTMEWVELNPNLVTNSYAKSRFVYDEPQMKYYESGKQISTFGVDISSKCGVVDFKKLKKAGCDFVMLKIGGRGYATGELIADDSFHTYMSGATSAGLDVGVYFYSQAVSKTEVKEELTLLTAQLKEYNITYPVVYMLEAVNGDIARTDGLDVATRTELAAYFMKEVKAAGYTPMLYGNKESLVTKYDMEELQKYDIWLAQSGESPDYPYAFDMWQYSTAGEIKGIEGEAHLNICMKDYGDD